MAFQAMGKVTCFGTPGYQHRPVQASGFVVSGIFAGLMGGMTAHFLHYNSPEDWTIMQSLTIQIFMSWGRGSPWGPIVGTSVLMTISEMLRGARSTALGVWCGSYSGDPVLPRGSWDCPIPFPVVCEAAAKEGLRLVLSQEPVEKGSFGGCSKMAGCKTPMS